jgi:hypothetical protein
MSGINVTYPNRAPSKKATAPRSYSFGTGASCHFSFQQSENVMRPAETGRINGLLLDFSERPG